MNQWLRHDPTGRQRTWSVRAVNALCAGSRPMRISRESSGNQSLRELNQNQGRGEYEWAELQDDDPAREELLNRRIMLRLAGEVLLDTACEFEYAQEKWRLRVSNDARADRHIYPIYHLAVALLFPVPTRQFANVGRGMPVLRTDEYFIEDIFSGAVRLSPRARADYEVSTVRVANQTEPGHDILIDERVARVQSLWQHRSAFSAGLAALLEEHEQLVRGGDQISITGRRLVTRIQIAAEEAVRDRDDVWATRWTDPVPPLLALAGLREPDPPATGVEEIAPEFPEIRRREIARQRRLAAARPNADRFRRQVRDAYRSTCIVCGLSLPRLWDDGRAGVDAAHILPDAEFDLNHISNGLCLCKIHHWALDEGLVVITHDDGRYAVEIPEEAVERAAVIAMDLEFLDDFVGRIPQSRLPERRAHWPNPKCLQRLSELLYP